MNPSRDGYKKWAETADFQRWKENHADDSYDCDIVVKIVCVSHVSKKFAKKVEEFGKSGEKLDDGKVIIDLEKKVGSNYRRIFEMRLNEQHGPTLETYLNFVKHVNI